MYRYYNKNGSSVDNSIDNIKNSSFVYNSPTTWRLVWSTYVIYIRYISYLHYYILEWYYSSDLAQLNLVILPHSVVLTITHATLTSSTENTVPETCTVDWKPASCWELEKQMTAMSTCQRFALVFSYNRYLLRNVTWYARVHVRRTLYARTLVRAHIRTQVRIIVRANYPAHYPAHVCSLER